MISIVCPLYNEKDCLEVLVTRLLSSTEQLTDPWEIIFVNDGSVDGSGDYLRFLTQDKKGIRIVELDRNYGLTTALYAGLQHAKGEIIATLDADLQNPPEQISSLVETLKKEKVDMVTGCRANRKDTHVKKISSKIANHIRRSVIRDTIQDTGCSLRVFKKEVLDSFLPYQGMHRFFAPIAQAHGFKIKQVPVPHEHRQFGKAKYGLFNRIGGPLWDLIAIRWILSRKIKYKLRSAS